MQFHDELSTLASCRGKVPARGTAPWTKNKNQIDAETENISILLRSVPPYHWGLIHQTDPGVKVRSELKR